MGSGAIFSASTGKPAVWACVSSIWYCLGIDYAQTQSRYQWIMCVSRSCRLLQLIIGAQRVSRLGQTQSLWENCRPGKSAVTVTHQWIPGLHSIWSTVPESSATHVQHTLRLVPAGVPAGELLGHGVE